MSYLFVGVLIIWIGILVYMGRLFKQQKKVSRQIEELQNMTANKGL